MVSYKSLFANERVQVEKGSNQLNQLYPGLLRYCRFLAKNKWDADDLVQESVLKAIQHYHSSDVSPALLNKIAYHQWIDTIRKRNREVVGFHEEQLANAVSLNTDDLLDTVMLLVNKLTPKQAIIFLLKEAFSFQAKEIADLLDTSEMAVKALIHRTRKRLEKETNLQSVDSYWCEEERELLGNLIYQSLQSEDPTIIIEYVSDIPSLANVPKLAEKKYSPSSLDLYCIAS
ncbi:sigma-70 family RNA polymerase sigma factor [Cytobacillus praedii]|uniref:sigma-70 family RNA polymerase sigma factor n=1 Tax=Cytobacillus praedii TaxID=1742358 RepID=UPI002E1FE00B|nr:sigma-70 family RNA polymerase sigma factor [Cytobacillus praedii]MED3553272.1 sigma-70 family RNA polymerase sigma factor [Cytobacillus praedii]